MHTSFALRQWLFKWLYAYLLNKLKYNHHFFPSIVSFFSFCWFISFTLFFFYSHYFFLFAWFDSIVKIGKFDTKFFVLLISTCCMYNKKDGRFIEWVLCFFFNKYFRFENFFEILSLQLDLVHQKKKLIRRKGIYSIAIWCRSFIR